VLRAFRRVALDAGKKTRVSIDLPIADLAHHDAATKRAVVDPGSYEVLLGASSSDIRQRAKFDVTAP
jgi:beta-glucosidase